jgi:ribosomal protein S18 acetylase RimI-like enzyme
MDAQLCIVQADYANPAHADALVRMLDAYAQDPMGGGERLSEFARTHVVAALAARPFVFSILAFAGDTDDDASKAVGLVNCIEGFSTFACRPLINIHDLAVLPGYRGQRIGERMLERVEAIACERGACKLTLEVLQGNQGARRLYQRVGFASYELDPTMGQAQFLQKWLT